MPQPTLGDVHVSTPLTQMSIAYMMDESLFVADKVFPMVAVQKQADLYYRYTKSDFFRDEARKRAPGTESAGSGFTVSTSPYSCDIWSWHSDIADPIRANADSQINLDESATRVVTNRLLLRRERLWASTFFTSGVWATDITPGTLWSAASGSTPLRDVEVGKLKIQQDTGLVPNTMVMGPQVLSALRDNPAIRDQFKYTSADSIDLNMIARYFGIEKCYIVNAVFDSAVEGAASAMQFVSGRHALLTYVPPSPGMMQVSGGYTFAWNGYHGAGMGTRMKKFRMEHLASDRIEGEMSFDMRVVCNDAGYFFNNVVA